MTSIANCWWIWWSKTVKVFFCNRPNRGGFLYSSYIAIFTVSRIRLHFRKVRLKLHTTQDFVFYIFNIHVHILRICDDILQYIYLRIIIYRSYLHMKCMCMYTSSAYAPRVREVCTMGVLLFSLFNKKNATEIRRFVYKS